MITNGDITTSQRKTYNVLLHDARKQVKENPNKILFYFSLSDLKDRARIHATNNVELKRNLDKLRFISVETVHENGDWCAFNLLSQVEKKGEGLEIQLPEKIRQALISNDYYTTLDLMVIKNLQGKYAVILYEFAMRYNKVQLPELTLQEFRELTGTEKIKSYDNFNNNEVKVIKPAIKEINEKTDIKMSYETIKPGRSVTGIKFKVSLKKQAEPTQAILLDEQAAKPKTNIKITAVPLFQYDEQVLILFNMLPEKEQTESNKKELSDLLENHSFEMLKADIEYCRKQKTIKDFWGYFVSSTKKGHFGKKDLEKQNKKEEIKSKKKTEKEEENDEYSTFVKNAKELFADLEKDNPTYQEYLEKYNQKKEFYEKRKLTFEQFAITEIAEELREISEELDE